jgi:hypothetical protein
MGAHSRDGGTPSERSFPGSTPGVRLPAIVAISKEKDGCQKKGVALIARVWLIRGAYNGDPIWKRQLPPRV